MIGDFTMNKNHSLLFATALAAAGMTSVAQAGALRVTVDANQAQANTAAGEIGFAVSNFGAGRLDVVRVIADRDHAARCASITTQGRAFAPSGSLEDGDSVRCTSHALTQSRLRNASVVVLARDGNGNATSRSVSFAQPAGLTPAQGLVVLAAGGIHNDSNSDGILQAGETISYDYSVLNLGTLALSGLAVVDMDGNVSCPQTTLAINATMTCSRVHAIIGAEASAGMVFNQVDISGVDANADPVLAGDFVVTQNLGGDAGIRVFKSPLLANDVDASGYASLGDLLTYSFVVKNDNAQTLNTVNLIEPDPSRIDTPITCNPTTLNGQAFAGLGSGTLLSNDVVLCSADYTIKPADVTAGEADNLVEATAQPGIGGPVQGTAASAVLIPTLASIEVSKALTGENGSVPGVAEPGEVLTYTITLANSGGATAFNVGMVDPLDPNVVFVSASNGGTLSGTTVTWSGLSISGGGNLNLTVTVQVIDPVLPGTAHILNLAYVTGTTPPNCVDVPQPPACVDTPAQSSPTLQVTKTVSSPIAAPGGTATYTISVTNVGTVTANNVTISDPYPPGITAFQWTCTASGGATCANASGSGPINELIATFPPGGQLVYSVIASVANDASGIILNQVTVTPSQNTVCMPQVTLGPCDASTPVTVRQAAVAPIAVPMTDAWALLLIALGVLAVAWRGRERFAR
ncbi:MAG: DUF11 domain-containing protein [Xanthomonadales bacterium]|nr:DUF11 domain-containing protein [Xanthomonadales bacterium]